MIYSTLTALSCLFFTTTDLNAIDVQDLIKPGLQFAYVEAFDSAKSYFDKVISLHPENPAGYFFKAALLQVKMLDECQFSDEKEYLVLIKQVSKKSEEILEKEDNLWATFYLGSSYTYRAVFEGLKSNYFEAFRYGVSGGKILQSVIKKDSTFYDAYLGSGSYEYFWARAARYLPVLKLMGGDVNEAIRKLHVAAEKSLYSGPTAMNSLVFIYGEEGQYDKATNIINSLLIEYPQSRTLLWNKANLEFKKKNYRLAADLYNKIFAVYDSLGEKNYANLAQCQLFIGNCFYELKEKEKAKEALKEVIGFKKYADQYPQIKKYCRAAYGLLGRLL